MKKVALFMSDFHLGQKDRMEEFYADQEFAELLSRLSREHAGDEVDLVLLGDVMDLWTTITSKKEINAQAARDVDIYFPVPPNNAKAMAYAVTEELKKICVVMDSHAVFFEALGKFLAEDPGRRRVLYIPGNHDHSVVERETLQPFIRDRILPKELKSQFSPTQQAKLVQFPSYYYDDTILRVYAEHGNQLTFGGVYKYDDFDTFGSECPGYFELKLVWNRLERRAAELDNVFMGALSPGLWPGLFGWLLLKGNWRHWFTLRKYKIQYEHDDRVADSRDKMPPWWKAMLHMFVARWQDTKDEFWDQVPQLFDRDGKGEKPLGWKECRKTDPANGGRLNQLRIKTVVLGHSHHTKDETLPGLDGVKYYNTGSWIFQYENGRRIVEQAWLRIMADMDGQASGRSIIDRQMFRRRVELPRMDSSPVTQDGRSLNPAMREMEDIRVGDVALFHWNFEATISRLLKSFQIAALLREIPHMIGSWLNRFGSNSYWSHAALIYGAPSEKDESEDFTDPLFLEALPDTGVGLHGPRHYLTHRDEWNLAIVRPKVPWLKSESCWENRRFLRRMALSILDADYDNSQIKHQAIGFSTRMMDEEGKKETVTALFKGGIWGIRLSTLAVLGWIGWMIATTVREEGWLALWHKLVEGVAAFWAGTIKVLQAVGVIGLLQNFGVLALFNDPKAALSAFDLLLLFIGLCLVAALSIISLLAVAGFARLVVVAWVRLTAAVGAAWGLLIIPVMAELSDGWKNRSQTWRWAATFSWATVPVIVVGAGLKGVRIEIVTAFMVFAALFLVWFSRPFIWVVEQLIVKPVLTGHALWRKLVGRIFLLFGWILGKESKKMPHFICSGLVQYAFVLAARELQKRDPTVDPADVIANPNWKPGMQTSEEDRLLKLTIHQDFADASEPVTGKRGTLEPPCPMKLPAADPAKKFEWIYLFSHGTPIRYPRPSQLAEVEPDRLTRLEGRKLSQAAAWSLQMALLGLYCTTLVELGLIQMEWVPAALQAGVVCGAVAIWLAYKAHKQLAINPEGVRGRWLTRWGGRLGYTAIAAAIAATVGEKTMF